MHEYNSCEATLLEHFDWMQQAFRTAARRHSSTPEEVEDFASWAIEKMIENDYAILRQFRGESSVKTYLAVVISMLNREFMVRKWGRWRTSAAAARGGRLATKMETLVYRDGYTFDQAALMLRMSGQSTMSERELRRVFATLPRRTAQRGRWVRGDCVDAPDPLAADDAVLTEEAHEDSRDAESLLMQALSTLPEEDYLIVRMRFWDDMSVADISRQLQLPQKPLYRRLERALTRLRHDLERCGWSAGRARAVLEHVAA